MSKTNLTKCVCVWLDTVSEPGTETWIVSQDRIELSSGRSASTRTLDCLDAAEYDREDAIESGREEAERLGLPLYLNPEGGDVELIEDYTTKTVAEVE